MFTVLGVDGSMICVCRLSGVGSLTGLSFWTSTKVYKSSHLFTKYIIDTNTKLLWVLARFADLLKPINQRSIFMCALEQTRWKKEKQESIFF